MAKLERRFRGDFNSVLNRLHQGIISGSATASFEDGSRCDIGDIKCAVRVYERYSMMGSNRVSLNITLIGAGEELFLSAITSGGSQGMFLKLNTIGEEAFLDKLESVINQLEREGTR